MHADRPLNFISFFMPIEIAVWLVRLGYGYIAIGLLLLPWWHLRGLQRLDHAAGSGPWGFRVLVSPGLVALWPWLLTSAVRGSGEPEEECNAHRKLARVRVENE